MKQLILLLIFILVLPYTVCAHQVIYVAGIKSTKANYDKMLEEKGGDSLKITDYYSSYVSRPVISLIIIRQALKAGGMNVEISFRPFPNFSRAIGEVKRGKALILASDIWEEQFDDEVYKTAPFIRKGEFEKGIYTSADSELLDKPMDLPRLLKSKPLTCMSWQVDLSVLHKMGFGKIETAPNYSLLFKMMSKKRADFALLEFPRGPSPHYSNDETLYPVKGIKIVFPYSRHFMISKNHPHGYEVYKALERGLQILRENGTIEKALSQSKIINKETADWKIIWPEQN